MSTAASAIRFSVTVVGTLAVVLALVLGLVPGIAPPAEATHTVLHELGDPLDGNDFELDGNVTTSTGHDWDEIGDYAEGGEMAKDGTAKGNDETNWFKASTKESNYQDADPNKAWSFDGNPNADKSDLERLFVASQIAPNATFLWLAASRVSDEGNTQVTVEFNQKDAGDLTGHYRTTDDFFIRFNFPGKPTGQGGVDNVSVAMRKWTGATSGAYPAPDVVLDPGDFDYALGGLATGNETDFIEMQIDLEAIVGAGGLNVGCTTFGSVSFRTESSGGSANNNDPSLKDMAGPFPIDLDTCAETDVIKYDDNDQPLDEATFHVWSGGVVGDIADAVASCTTGPTGGCSFGPLAPGTYSIDETVVPPGYRKDPALLLPFVVEANTPKTLVYNDPRVPYTIEVVESATNALDDTDPDASKHTFTVTLTDDLGGLKDQTIDLEWSGSVGDIVEVDGVGITPTDATTCTTDDNGQCSVTVNTTEGPGGGTLTASWDTPYQNTVPDPQDRPSTTAVNGNPPTVAYPTIEDSATKNWVGLGASIEANGTNLLGDPHPFTITVWEIDGTGADDGSEDDDEAVGVTVTVDWTGPTGSRIDDDADPSDGSLTTTTCTTNGDGQCTVWVGSDTNGGLGTAEVSSVTGTVTGGETATTTFASGEVAATKIWRIYRASISGNSVNPAGQSHEFKVTVEYSDDNGATWDFPDPGVSVTWTDPDGKNDLDASTCDDPEGTDPTDGTCLIVVHSDAPDEGTVTVTHVNGDLVPGGTTSEEYDVADVQATKIWLGFTVDIVENATNLVDEPHDFTVTVKQSKDGQNYTPVDAGSVIQFELVDNTASATVEEPETTCDDGTDVDGTCTVRVLSSTPGSVTVKVTGINQYAGFDTAADVTFPTAGEATKMWVDYRAHIAADGLNLVGDEHVFTVTAEVDDGTGWRAVDKDTIVTVTASGHAGAEVDQSDCADGTLNGTCLVKVNADTAGTITVTVDKVQNLTATDSDVEYVDVSDGANLETGQSEAAAKTWAAFRALISRDAVNVTGDEHEFTVLAEYTVDGSTWLPLPDGSTVEVSASGDGEIIDRPGFDTTCEAGIPDDGEGTVGGVCSVWVDTDDSGSLTVTVDGVEATIVINEGQPDELERTFPVDFGRNKQGDPNLGLHEDFDRLDRIDEDDYRGTKAWVLYALVMSEDATNAVDDPHTFRATLTVDEGNGPDPVDGAAITFSLAPGSVGQVADGSSLDCTTDALGVCAITIVSSEGGTTVVEATFETLVEQTPVTLGADGVKTWVDISLVKTAVVGDEFGDGDLVLDAVTGLPTLFFTSSDQGPKTAVFEYLITNTGAGTLRDVALVDDRLGDIDLPADLELAPGESYTARASETYTYADAAASLVEAIRNVGVVTALGDDQSEVSDTDDAFIALVATPSQIALQLEKSVVTGAGDVLPGDGDPTVPWSEEEFEAQVDKTVRYSFTVTNVGDAPVVDVELTDPLISDEPLIAVADGVTLAPGESTTIEVDWVLPFEVAFPDGLATDVPNVATVTGANETRDSFAEDTDDAIVSPVIVLGVILQAPVVESVELPATGLTTGALFPIALLLLLVGTAMVWREERRTRV